MGSRLRNAARLRLGKRQYLPADNGLAAVGLDSAEYYLLGKHGERPKRENDKPDIGKFII
jgi:hypothetical protein